MVRRRSIDCVCIQEPYATRNVCFEDFQQKRKSFFVVCSFQMKFLLSSVLNKLCYVRRMQRGWKGMVRVASIFLHRPYICKPEDHNFGSLFSKCSHPWSQSDDVEYIVVCCCYILVLNCDGNLSCNFSMVTYQLTALDVFVFTVGMSGLHQNLRED